MKIGKPDHSVFGQFRDVEHNVRNVRERAYRHVKLGSANYRFGEDELLLGVL